MQTIGANEYQIINNSTLTPIIA